ncbi:MAG: putative glycoside hydrolase [Actinomycetota bacterium]
MISGPYRSLLVSAMLLAACGGGESSTEEVGRTPDAVEDGEPATETAEPTTTTTTVPTVGVTGVVVSAVDGVPLAGSTVEVAGRSVATDEAGRFEIEDVGVDATLTVSRPVWRPWSQELSATDQGDDTDRLELRVELEPVVVRGLRVSAEVAADDERFDELLALADGSTVNALVFDTKDESNRVLYATEVETAYDIGAVDAVYDPAERLAAAREQGLYTVTRVVTFEDGSWATAVPEAKLAGAWVDAGNEANWAYPLALAVEACELGFDEVQFDYVRFPAGRTADLAAPLMPATSAERAAVIERFLGQARDRLHPMGCGVSAAIFGIVMSSETDEGIGQTPETVSAVVDAVSPMLYPSHYGPGWLGFADPNEHPGPVIAHALDTGADKVRDGVLVRPWIQGFDYNGAQVQAQITEIEARGAGWIIWNFAGNYRRDWLPSS